MHEACMPTTVSRIKDNKSEKAFAFPKKKKKKPKPKNQ
jgi:hypothetical protein